jgi:MFS family permease
LPSQSRLLTIHSGLYQLSVSLAGGFVGAFLLKLGFTVAQALLVYAGLLAARLAMRFCALALVRRVGYKYAIMLGAALSALQFVSLADARQWHWLLAWALTVSLAESIYWPIYHCASAVVGYNAMGRELGIRAALTSIISVVGPALGGVMLAKYGPTLDFAIASVVTVLSVLPLIFLKRILAGPVPEIRRSLRASDSFGMIVFAADGWVSSGITITWPMILFVSLGSRYDALGLANAAAGLVGALAGLYCGKAIDRGGRARYVLWVSLALAIGIAIRSTANWSPHAATLANAAGAAATGFYVPILMSIMYEGAKRSAGAYAFHFAAEGGWDVGAAVGCIAAAVVAMSGAPVSMAVIPSALGVAVLYGIFRNVAPSVRQLAPL